MFETVVVGPIFAERLGIVRQCIECRKAAGPNASPCPGFGPGCLIRPSHAEGKENTPWIHAHVTAGY
jgi:hypothetical protein